ncbi:hypothetical protein TRFO_28589 [Tritrichomonas foetus]|uniref:Clathrin/coatomer adaptor adaptin-like N-terminal domain-containing protein n=1 Tax=Tritrichomonas foetus TaxID=1144522 RepID=A0A1J4K2M2_9EUKA|nr:hypothetical protein TRFO_28589 [Tritrichomonas foetus]|eukprot:OHT03996.1 hypothetical protein TRFO_28589 [Tritrichomonas foetus]
MLAFMQNFIPSADSKQLHSSDSYFQDILQALFDSMKSKGRKNEKNKINVLSVLLKQHFYEYDLSFLSFEIISLLASNDTETILLGLRACCFILNNTSHAIDMIPSVLNRTFQYQDLLIPSLRALSFVINPYVFKKMETPLIEIASTSSYEMARIYALLSIFKVYQIQNDLKHKDNKVLIHLLPLLQRSIFQPSLRLISVSILCEISLKEPEKLVHFNNILLAELPNCSPSIFMKLTRYFKNQLHVDKSLQEKLIITLPKYFVSLNLNNNNLHENENNEIKALIDSVNLISHFEGNSIIFQQLGTMLENVLMNNQDINVQYLCLNCLLNIFPRYHPDPTIIAALTNSYDLSIVGNALQLKCLITKNKLHVIYELIANATVTRNYGVVEMALSAIPRTGKKFVSALFSIYQLQIPKIEPLLSKTLFEIEDKETCDHFISQAVEGLFEPPDDDFGYSIAYAVGEWSNNPNDIELLLPPSLGQLSTHLQSVLLASAISLWFRINYTLSKGYKNRLELLTQSHTKEVRQQAQILIKLMED